jgi:hypothetical protein
MTQATDKEDEQWLSALAGRPALDADPQVNRQAEALHRALKARSEMLETQVPKADAAQYQQILFRLRKEGLTSSHRNWQSPMLWGMAATVVLGIGVVFQMGGLHHDQDDANTLRGGGQSTVLIVNEPEVRLAELLAGLRAAGEEPSIKREADGRIVLTAKGTEKVLDYLTGQRIEPTLAQGKLTIELRSVKSPK